MGRKKQERQIKDDNYFTIFGWMTNPNKMNLSGLELQVYAIVYGFSQAKRNYFTASHSYVAEFCGCSEEGVKKTLKNLTQKGFITKEQTGYNAYRYKAKRYEQLLKEKNPYIGHEPEPQDEKINGVLSCESGVPSCEDGVLSCEDGVLSTSDIKKIDNDNNIYNARARAIPQKRAPDKSKNQKNNKFMNFDQRDDIDYQLLEERLLNKSSP